MLITPPARVSMLSSNPRCQEEPKEYQECIAEKKQSCKWRLGNG